MQNSNYQTQAQEVFQKHEKYRKDLRGIFMASTTASSDVVKYIMQVLKDDSLPEIGKVAVEVAFDQKASLLVILKFVVKVLYLTKNMKKYKYTVYYALKKSIDEALTNSNDSKAYMAKKKYELLLERLNGEDIDALVKNHKDQAVDSTRETINRQYIKFV